MVNLSRLALITCLDLPEPDPDQDLLLDTLIQGGIQAELLAWDDPTADPGEYDLCVLRSCWNYYEDPGKFLSWVEHAASVSRLMNSPQVVRWNLHKEYLGRLASAGIAIVPTGWFERGEQVDLVGLMREREWEHVVLKPAVSAASFMTRHFCIDQAAEGQRFLDSILSERDAMVQLFMPSVEHPGERALVWIDGEFTHTITKRPRFLDGEESVSEAGTVSEKDCLAAEKALSLLDDTLLYARVDFMEDDAGSPLVSEFELIEPSLFLLQSPYALERFVSAIERLVHGRG